MFDFNFNPECQTTVGTTLNGERKYIRFVELLKQYDDEKFFNKNTKAIAIFSGKFCDERCEIIDEETDILIIARARHETKVYAYKNVAFPIELEFVVNGEFTKERVPRDAKAAYNKFIKSIEA